MNITSLKENGFKIDVTHIRRDIVSEAFVPSKMIPSEYIGARGGFTYVRLIAPSGRRSVGVAKCHENDNYDKKVGVAKALGRAYAALGL